MEKRFILALIISFAILFLWNSLFPMPKKMTQKYSQNIENNEDKQIFPNSSIGNTAPPPTSLPIVKTNEKMVVLESKNLILKFLNIGGTLNSVEIKGFNAKLPLANILNLNSFKDYEFNLVTEDHNRVIYVYEDKSLKISKSYTLSKDSYDINAEILVENKENMSKVINLDFNAITLDMSNLNKNNEFKERHAIDKTAFEYVIYSPAGYIRKNNANTFSTKEDKSLSGKVDWIGFRNKYFCLIVKPRYESSGYSLMASGAEKMNFGILSKGITIGGGGSASFAFTIFAGPEKYDILKKYNMGFENIKMFYRFGLFDVTAKIMYRMLHVIHRFLPNWGLAIIIISIMIYGAMYPLTRISMSSMKKMQLVQPKIAELREKYKNNPQRLNKEMVELYKQEGVNPFGGCLPFLLQLPIFIGIYQVLWRDVSLKGADFLWIKDLTEPDRLIIFPFTIPFVGNEFNILPLVYGALMFFQQKLSMKSTVAVDPSQAEMQKMMANIMPIMLAVVFYKFASGLTLYFTIYFSLTTLTQWKMSKI